MKELLRKLRYWLGSRSADSALGEEMRFHLESRIEELLAEGMPVERARSIARRELGSPLRIGEESRRAWAIEWLDDFQRDCVLALRSLRREPAFAFTAVACLALGIGANTAIFSLANELLLVDPSCANPDRLVNLQFGGNSHARPEAERFLREEAKPFDAIEGWTMQETNWRHGDESERVFAMHVTDGYFGALGIPLLAGRGLDHRDENAVVLSEPFWRARFNADSAAIGRTITLDARPHTIIGILAPRHRTFFGGGVAPSLYALAARGANRPRLALVARLPTGLSRVVALSKLEAAGAAMDRLHPDPDMSYARNNRVTGVTGGQQIQGPEMQAVAGFFALLLGLVWLVFLMACINVQGLLLARATARHSETALRLALGAGRSRLIRLHLAETFVLAIGGCGAGLLINLGLMGAVSRIRMPVAIPIQFDIAPDLHLFAYAFALVFAAVLFSGMLPAFRATRANLSDAIKSQSGSLAGERQRLRSILVTAQVAVSCVLLATGFVFWRNLQLSARLDTGFRLSDTIMTAIRFDPNAPSAAVESALERIREVPGVRSAGRVAIVPFNDDATRGVYFESPETGKRIKVSYHWNGAGPGYFESIGIPMRAGREFDSASAKAVPRQVIVNENLARRLFGNRNAVGAKFLLPTHDGDREAVVIGVAGNSKQLTLGETGHFALYEPLGESRDRMARIIVRSRTGDPGPLLRPIRAAVQELHPAAAVEVKLLRDSIGLALIPSQAGAIAAGSMGLIGLLLASIGLFGILSYSVARRRREIGLRMALGAPSRRVAGLVLARTAKLAGLGIAIGLAISVFALQPLEAFIVPELRPNDPVHLVAAGAVLLVVALIASAAPVSRALRVEPAIALRE